MTKKCQTCGHMMETKLSFETRRFGNKLVKQNLYIHQCPYCWDVIFEPVGKGEIIEEINEGAEKVIFN